MTKPKRMHRELARIMRVFAALCDFNGLEMPPGLYSVSQRNPRAHAVAVDDTIEITGASVEPKVSVRGHMRRVEGRASATGGGPGSVDVGEGG